jgi:hypothetical protein
MMPTEVRRLEATRRRESLANWGWMMTLFRLALLLLNATLIAWLSYYVFKLPGDPLGYALLFFLPANLLFLLLVAVRPTQ